MSVSKYQYCRQQHREPVDGWYTEETEHNIDITTQGGWWMGGTQRGQNII